MITYRKKLGYFRMSEVIQLKRKNSKDVQKRSDEKRKNDPKRIEYVKKLHQQPHIIKNNKICTWKRRGVIDNDFDSLYDNYSNATNCDRCDIVFDNTIKKMSKCLDHDHDTGFFRNFLCNSCNWTHMRKDRTVHKIPLVITDKHYNCECGSVVLTTGKKRHESTKIHLCFLN
jgi:hypothetical protein